MVQILETRLNAYSPAVLSLFRVVFGFMFAIHGTGRLFGWPEGVTTPAHFGVWPFWWAGLIELVTGVLIMIGLFTRPAAFIAAGHMAVTYFWRHQPDTLWPHVNEGERAVLYCFAFLLLVFTGGGAYALDAVLASRARRRQPLAGK
jgi:putative oxidoreductase